MIGTILDIETTGYLKFDDITVPNPLGYGDPITKSQLSDASEILEVGFINVDLDTARIVNHGTLYFYKPYFQIESKAQEVHGITREFLQKYEQNFEKNLIALNSLMQNAVIIGKNSKAFDVPFIKAFIEKHAGNVLDIPRAVTLLGMKGYYGGFVVYNEDIVNVDLQIFFKERFHELYAKKYSAVITKDMSEQDVVNLLNSRFPNVGESGYSICMDALNNARVRDMNMPVYPDMMHPKLTPTKKGSLEQYIDVIDQAQYVANVIYESLTKERVAGYHSALYDAVMTYVVWYDAKMNGVFGDGGSNEA